MTESDDECLTCLEMAEFAAKHRQWHSDQAAYRADPAFTVMSRTKAGVYCIPNVMWRDSEALAGR